MSVWNMCKACMQKFVGMCCSLVSASAMSMHLMALLVHFMEGVLICKDSHASSGDRRRGQHGLLAP